MEFTFILCVLKTGESVSLDSSDNPSTSWDDYST